MTSKVYKIAYTSVYVVIFDHKHGQDISVHKTEKGAIEHRITWMKDLLAEWEEISYNNLSDDELVKQWPEISGYNEFFEIRKLTLQQ